MKQPLFHMFCKVWEIIPATIFFRGPWIHARVRIGSLQERKVSTNPCPGFFGSVAIPSEKKTSGGDE